VVVLEQQGATVDAAASCSETLALLERSSPDVLVSDIGLPGADGYELIRTLRAREGAGTRLPAIALTAYARREDRRLALEAGFQAHVAKPVDPVELVNAVHEWAKRERA
jgi:CheY-like chemotaxis protein